MAVPTTPSKSRLLIGWSTLRLPPLWIPSCLSVRSGAARADLLRALTVSWCQKKDNTSAPEWSIRPITEGLPRRQEIRTHTRRRVPEHSSLRPLRPDRVHQSAGSFAPERVRRRYKREDFPAWTSSKYRRPEPGPAKQVTTKRLHPRLPSPSLAKGFSCVLLASIRSCCVEHGSKAATSSRL